MKSRINVGNNATTNNIVLMMKTYQFLQLLLLVVVAVLPLFSANILVAGFQCHLNNKKTHTIYYASKERIESKSSYDDTNIIANNQIQQEQQLSSYPSSLKRRKVLSSLLLSSSLVTASMISMQKPSLAAEVVINEEELANTSSAATIFNKKNNNRTKNPTPKKPFAPPSALLPAARVKYTIDESMRLVDEFIALSSYSSSALEEQGIITSNDVSNNKSREEEIIQILIQTLSVKTYMSPLPTSFASSTTKNNNNKTTVAVLPPIDESLMKPSNAKLYQESYDDEIKAMFASSPWNVPYALLVRANDYRQFDMLQQKQRLLEKSNPIREALNYYTRQLQFETEYYVLGPNVSNEERKRMIRNNALPDIKSVIVSDLDLRDLTRNQILDAYDDVKDELQYQAEQINKQQKNNKQSSTTFDGTELKVTLLRAKNECDRWFSYIPKDDIEQAMKTIQEEEQELQTV
mmetsp:Transcript_39117/g.44610  ORF Transcript_39117/g.44610 Transcript_39117/m.44610 type:complete len:463 (+) Transcript_39117:295-1683(+)|eukprot:CAMPEP_0194142084 /NCGR_PEP_ID=MMETSP0152-20130528/11405_1 /TAXON_ID=1049557 /ORGANISM="Thalassiothrix antarctica, Strain L6-D1" /LENGTH=462 /DNA_ID=CAMNT_0038840913 /DNA_START=289 /DNA_END=1677 /DNA_ORIENTATION=-